MKIISRMFALCLLLIVTGCAIVLSQVGADKRPPNNTASSSGSRSKLRQSAPQIEMVLIPAGTFMMGSPDGVVSGNNHPQHQVSVQSFYIGKYEVTQGQTAALVAFRKWWRTQKQSVS